MCATGCMAIKANECWSIHAVVNEKQSVRYVVNVKV